MQCSSENVGERVWSREEKDGLNHEVTCLNRQGLEMDEFLDACRKQLHIYTQMEQRGELNGVAAEHRRITAKLMAQKTAELEAMRQEFMAKFEELKSVYGDAPFLRSATIAEVERMKATIQ